MTRPNFSKLLILSGLFCMCCVCAEDLTPENYAHWRDYTLPKPGEEKWRAIPWLPTFYEGVTEAQKTEKPLLIWVMNGHPLSCT